MSNKTTSPPPHQLPRAVFAELTAIVSAANISEDDHVLASHDWSGIGGQPTVRSLIGNPPGAVVMPGSTEEVAAIVKACNRHGIRFKAHSTGYGNYAGTGTLGSVSIDLRRMNRLEIDAKNRMAIIEPYVTAGQLFAEANKHHLMCHIIGAGPTHSPLASATSMAGVGVMGNHTGNNVRNLLSAEWVTPEGEIVRIGSCGSEAGWFTGEGPGPGLRGMFRGVLGAQGGLGVFTRIGYKLYPWAGPAALEWTGAHPQRGLKLPPNFSYHHIVFDRWEDMAEATQHLHASKVAAFFSRTPPSGMAAMLTPTNWHHSEARAARVLPPEATAANDKNWALVLMAWSAEEHAWKQAVLQSILARCGGREMALAPEHSSVLAANAITSLYVARFNRNGSGAGISLGILDSARLLPAVVQRAKDNLDDQQRPGGGLMEADSDETWMWTSEGRHFWAENNPGGNRFDPKSLGACMEFMLRSFADGDDKPVGVTAFLMGPAADMFGSRLDHANRWMRRVKKTWDPKDLSDSKNMVAHKPEPIAKIFPLLRRTLLRPGLRKLARTMLAKPFK